MSTHASTPATDSQETGASATDPTDDFVQPFQLEGSDVRGRMVRLGPVLDAILKRHAYPPPVAALLGELATLSVLLGAMLKFDGVFTVQVKGAGPVTLMVVDVTQDGALRGYAQFDGDGVAAALQSAGEGAGTGAEGTASPAARSEAARLAALMGEAVPRLLGEGHLAFTVDQGSHTHRYQGIVALTGARLQECVEHYFAQSEQLGTRLRVAIGQILRPGGAMMWRSGGVILQEMPPAERIERADKVERTDTPSTPGQDGADDGDQPVSLPPSSAPTPAEAHGEDWRRCQILLDSCSGAEQLDPDLPAQALLYRLFHEEGVRVWPPRPLRDECRCSRSRILEVLASLPPEERRHLAAEGDRIEVACEFCGTAYHVALSEMA